MAFCPKCGAAVTDGTKFCGACGAPIAAAPNPPPIRAPFPSPPGQPPVATSSGLTPNVAAMLTYIPLCLIGLVFAIIFGFVLDPYRNNRFVRFHAWQSIAMHVVFIVFGIGWGIVSAILRAMSRFFAVLTFPVSMLVFLGGLVVAVFLMLKAYQNEFFKLPIVGDWAEKQAGG